MHTAKILSSGATIILMALLTIISTFFVLLVLSQMGVIAFTSCGFLVDSFSLISGYLGYSVILFLPVLLAYCFFFFSLKKSLLIISEPQRLEKIRFYNGGMELCITLFFAIGVLFTAWGLQNALVSAIGNVTEAEASRLGAWGILKRLVDNGILIALWTTIVGGAGGYLMRVVRYLFLGIQLNRFSIQSQEDDKTDFFKTMEAIRTHLQKIEEKITNTA